MRVIEGWQAQRGFRDSNPDRFIYRASIWAKYPARTTKRWFWKWLLRQLNGCETEYPAGKSGARFGWNQNPALDQR
jgi:hypothetical protein